MNAQAPRTQRDMRREPTSEARVFTLFLAVGVYVMLIGAVFLSPFALNATAIQNDVYMANLFIAPVIIIVGFICLLIGLIGMWIAARSGRASGIGWRPVIIGALGAVAMTALYLAFGGHDMDAYGVISWPPYMNEVSLVIAAVVGALVLVAVWLRGAGVRRAV